MTILASVVQLYIVKIDFMSDSLCITSFFMGSIFDISIVHYAVGSISGVAQRMHLRRRNGGMLVKK